LTHIKTAKIYCYVMSVQD